MQVLEQKQDIQEITIETLARSFFQESYTYGFNLSDYLRFINLLLDFALNSKGKTDQQDKSETISKKIKAVSLPLKGKQLIIRALEASKDLPTLKNWLSDEYSRYFLLSQTMARIITIDEFINKDKNIIGVICLNDFTPIGAIAFLDYDREQNKAELRKLIGDPEMRGMGFCKEAIKLWIQFGVTTLGIKKIYLNTLDTDIRNIKFNERLGFKVEGILRNEIFFDGKYHDVLRMAFCRE